MLPKEYGSGSTCHRRFQQWSTCKVFQRLWTRLLRVYDDLVGIQWNWQSLDSVSVKAPLVCVSVVITAANTHDMKATICVLDNIVVKRPSSNINKRLRIVLSRKDIYHIFDIEENNL